MPTYKQFCVALFMMMAGASSAWATVSLQLVDRVTSGPTNQVTLTPGPNMTFDIRLNLVTTSSSTEQSTGLDYYLKALGTGSGYFTILDRDISTSPYSEVLNDDATVELAPQSVLNDRNAWDLGAVVANPNTPVAGNTTQLVAFYKIGVASNIPLGSYVIETSSDPATGWTGNAADNFNDHDFNFQGSYNVIVPEPATIGLAGVAALGLLRRRR